MSANRRSNIKRFDIVMIRTIEHVKWLSGPASRPAKPQGRWSVVAGIGGNDDEVLIAKDQTLCKIPISDVVKVADYGPEHALESIKKVRNRSDLKKHRLGRQEDGKERN